MFNDELHINITTVLIRSKIEQIVCKVKRIGPRGSKSEAPRLRAGRESPKCSEMIPKRPSQIQTLSRNWKFIKPPATCKRSRSTDLPMRRQALRPSGPHLPEILRSCRRGSSPPEAASEELKISGGGARPKAFQRPQQRLFTPY